MKKSITTSLASDIHRHRSRPHGIFKLQNPLSGGRSANFRIPRSKMNSSSSHSSISNGEVELKSYSSTDLEQNFENLKMALNGQPSEEKKEQIVGPTGTVRGFKNLIKDRKKHLSKVGSMTALSEADDDFEGKIVFYSTSMGGIRSTIEDCRTVRKIFQYLRLKVDERDIFMHKEYQTELDNRTQQEGTPVPQVFVNRVHLGSTKEIIDLNERGQLKTLLTDFEKLNGTECETCGGFGYVNCSSCKGSKTSRKTRISREITVLKCTVCNENGLQRCPTCSSNSGQDAK